MSTIFMCWVEGYTRPSCKHATLELATEEAKRLSGLESVHGRVFVLADVAVIEKQQAGVAAKQQAIAPVITVKKKRLIVSQE